MSPQERGLLKSLNDGASSGQFAEIANALVAAGKLDRVCTALFEQACHSVADQKNPPADLYEVLNAEEASLLAARFGGASSCTSDLDWLASNVPVTPSTSLCYLANFSRAKSDEVAIATSIKNEGPWLLEWIAHHKCMGFEKIIVFYNDCDDGSASLLQLLHDRGIITAVENKRPSNASPQKLAFNKASVLGASLHSCRWVAFLDADEFVWPLVAGLEGIRENVQHIIEKSGTTEVDCIQIHWSWFSSPKTYYWEKGPITRRFPHSRANSHVKSIVNVAGLWSMERIHCPTLVRADPVVLNSQGDEIAGPSEAIDPPVYGALQLNHYFAKSFQEFALKKARGRGAVSASAAQREYSNFLWGSEGCIDSGLPNSRLIDKGGEYLNWLRSDPEIAEAAFEAEARARETISELEAEGLYRSYEQLMTGR